MTLHGALHGHVSFLPFPTESFAIPQTSCPREKMTRLFIGQLPYDFTDMELSWLVFHVCGGHAVFHIERIVRWRAGRKPSGCVHAYCFPADADALLVGLNDRLLFDDTGVWVSRNETEMRHLGRYCAAMKADPTLRPTQCPSQPVTAQLATSDYKLRAKHSKIVQRDQALRGCVLPSVLPCHDASQMRVWAPRGFTSRYFGGDNVVGE